MSDRAKLEEAIRHYKEALSSPALIKHPDLANALVAAAEAHLATLPKKKWGVSVDVDGRVGWVHFDTLEDAMAAVRQEAKAGWRVSIAYREITP